MKVRTILLSSLLFPLSCFAEDPKGISIQYRITPSSNSGANVRTQENRNIPVFAQIARHTESYITSYQRNGRLEVRVYPSTLPHEAFCKIEINQSEIIPDCELTTKRIVFSHFGSTEPRCDITPVFCVSKKS